MVGIEENMTKCWGELLIKCLEMYSLRERDTEDREQCRTRMKQTFGQKKPPCRNSRKKR